LVEKGVKSMKIRMKKRMQIGEKSFNFRRGERKFSERRGGSWGKGVHSQLGCSLEGCSLGLCIPSVISSGNYGGVSLVGFAMSNAHLGREV
jgi:hypothetical protein